MNYLWFLLQASRGQPVTPTLACPYMANGAYAYPPPPPPANGIYSTGPPPPGYSYPAPPPPGNAPWLVHHHAGLLCLDIPVVKKKAALWIYMFIVGVVGVLPYLMLIFLCVCLWMFWLASRCILSQSSRFWWSRCLRSSSTLLCLTGSSPPRPWPTTYTCRSGP